MAQRPLFQGAGLNTHLKSLNPVILIRDGYDWAGRSGRLAFVAAYAVWLFLLLSVKLFPPFSLPAAILLGLAGGLTIAALGHIRRRLRDIGWSGWWIWACLIPYLGFAVLLFLAFKRSIEEEAPPARGMHGGFVLAGLLAIFVISRVIWEPYWIPSGNMKPALLPGDYVVATRLISPPDRGDVVILRHPTNGKDFVKRVIGLPGERVQITGGQLVLNGVAVDVKPQGDWIEIFDRQGPMNVMPRCANAPVQIGDDCIKSLWVETLPNEASYQILDIGMQRTDNTNVYTIPEGNVFVLGDNRDNSNDSRFSQTVGGLGMVPIKNVVGRLRFVAYSMTGVPGRVLKGIQ